MNREEILSLFTAAREGSYAVGSFSPRNTVLIDSVLQAAESQRSPALVQISSNELKWFSLTSAEFARAYLSAKPKYRACAVLHLDHTMDPDAACRAVDDGFESVMLDGSRQPYEENIRLTRLVVDYAHARGVCVEGELGSIGGADQLETMTDQSLYTDPLQAEDFVRRTGCDLLAVSVGTAHGVYPVKNPHIDFERLRDIRQRISQVLVLHGGSGLPEKTIHRAIREGVGKINIATDLEIAYQLATGVKRMPNAETEALPQAVKAQGVAAVRALCEDRMQRYLLSAGKAV